MESAEDLGLSHEVRPVGASNRAGSFSDDRVPRAFRTTNEARACNWDGCSSESADSERVRVEQIGEIFDFDLLLGSRVEN